MKSGKILVIIIMSVSGLFVSAQGSLLYNSDGRLIADTIYQIDINDLEHVKYFETWPLQRIYADIAYPRLAYENGIKGLVIAKLLIMKGKLDIYCKIVKSADPLLGETVRKAVNKNALLLLRAARTDKDIVFYVPFEFELKEDSFEEGLNKDKLIKIHKNHFRAYQSF